MAIPVNRIKAAQAAGHPAFGVYVQDGSADNVELAAAGGLDYVILDGQHGLGGFDATLAQIRAAEASGVTPLVRIAADEPTLAMRYLDAGALGIVVPDIAMASQAAAMASAVRFKLGANGGTRGACPSTRAALRSGLDWGSFVRWSNENVLLWLIVETQRGLDNFDEIVAVPGVDAYLMGTFDLSHELGVFGERSNPAVNERFLAMARKARARGVPLVRSIRSSTHEGLRSEVQEWLELGACAFGVGADRPLLRDAYASRVEAMQRALGANAGR